jgi:L-cysteine:1D-myo-inositol 2-amino-2-deoxy-alpha-D-glucopyranoside ligase
VSGLRAQGADPMAVRLALLAHHYRSDWEWTGADLDRAMARLTRWREAVRLPAGPPAAPLADEVRRHLANDLDAPAALVAVDRWAEHAVQGDGTDERAPGQARGIADALLGIAL